MLISNDAVYDHKYNRNCLSDTPAFSKKNDVKGSVSLKAGLFSIRLHYSENVSLKTGLFCRTKLLRKCVVR